MIIVSAGMQRSGTRWYYNLTNDLLVAAGHPSARDVRAAYDLDFLRGPHCYMGRPLSWKLRRLSRVERQGVTCVVKTHRRPSHRLRRYLATGRFKATYCFRDLRDVIVSGLDAGASMRRRGATRRYFGIGPYRHFARLYTVKGAISWARWQLVPCWNAWMQCKGVLVTRFEDLLADTHGQLKYLAKYLDLDVSDEQIATIVATYSPDLTARDSFNRGSVGRYRQVLTLHEQKLCVSSLGRYLKDMGYLV